MTLIIIVWGARGRWFESSHPDKASKASTIIWIVDAFSFAEFLGIYKRCENILQMNQHPLTN